MDISSGDSSSIRPAFNKLTIDQVLLDTWLKMRDARAEQNTYKQFSYFTDLVDVLLNHLPKEMQDNMEEDLNIFWNNYDSIMDVPEKDLAKAAKDDYIRRLKENFMETHKRYVTIAFPRSGIQTVEDDGIIDFSNLDFDLLRNIVRAGRTGTPTLMKEMSRKIVTEKDIIGE